MSTDLKRPSLTIDLKRDDGSEETIKLSYGLFQDIQRVIPDPAMIVDVIISDPETRDYLIRRALTPTKKLVKDPDTELVQAEDMVVSDPDELDKLLQWIVGHMLYFFATSAGGIKQLSTALAAALKVQAQPAPSTSGSPS